MLKEKFLLENTQEWNEILHSIFGDIIPAECKWTEKEEMISVLNKICSGNSTNYTFFPDGGGMTLTGAVHSNEDGCIELDFDGAHIIKLKSLSFVAIGTDPGCSYFRLETADLKPSGACETNRMQLCHEHLVELSPLKYIDGKYWDYGEYNSEELPSSARTVSRLLRGDLVIFSKSSVYNQVTNTDDGRHAKMVPDTFKKYVSEMYRAYQDLFPSTKAGTSYPSL
jgi:hypothetical protein